MHELKFIDDNLIKFNYDFPIFNWFYPYNADEISNIKLKKELQLNSMNIFNFLLEDPSDVALYFHIPFCEDICSFCPFSREILKEESKLNRYIDALIKEIELKNKYLNSKKIKINSIFFGGGTPSILSKQHILKLGENIQKSFDLKEMKEFSFEMNAKTITEEKAIALKEIGVTHVRVGIQTFSKKYRAAFALSATIDQIENGISILKKYFSNVSIDIMYGFNGETISDFLKDLKKAISLDVPNISLYPLNNRTIQERLIKKYSELGLLSCTGLDRIGFKIIAREFMTKNGYFPHNGHDFYKVKENPKEFLTEEYTFEYHRTVYGKEKSELIAFGVSAISFFNGFITMNEKSIESYIKNFEEKHFCDMIILSYDKILDKNKPISLYLPYHGKIEKNQIDFTNTDPLLLKKLNILIEKDLVRENERTYFLTESGWLSYVNILYFLSPKKDQDLLIELIEESEKKRDIGLWNFEF